MGLESELKELEKNIDSLERFIEQYTKLEKKTERPKNIFSVLRGPKEGKYQSALIYFLDPAQPHGFKDAILKAFLNLIEEKSGDSLETYSSGVKHDHIEINTEANIKGEEDEYGRIDIIIAGGTSSKKHPEWAIFLELKVGASEGEEQTKRYAKAPSWNLSWFGNNTLSINRLDEHEYVYIRKEREKEAKSDVFESISWADIVKAFEEKIEKGVFDYPHRSVVQFLDFLRSLKEMENMGDESKEKELELIEDRLDLYFNQKELIEKVEEANRQFQQDFEELSQHLHETWEDRLDKIYDFSGSDWITIPSRRKYENILPKYWFREPLEESTNTMKIFFRHSPTTDHLREKELSFRLRLPPARKVQINEFHSEKSFNELFCEKIVANKESLKRTIEDVRGKEFSLGTASALIKKRYELDEKNLYKSYLKNLEKGCEEFCENEDLIEIVNECFEEAFRESFGKEPTGEKARSLKKNKE